MSLRMKKKSRRTMLHTASLAAPLKGWNVRDSIANMDALDAITMENFWPTAADVMLRRGYTRFSTGLPGQVETVMTYAGFTASSLWAISSGNLYNITAGGAVGAATLTGFVNSRWQHVNYATSANQFLLMVNGSDTGRQYDGTSWSDWTVTGISTANVIHLNVFKERLWLLEVNSLSVWYLPVDSVTGTATEFSLEGYARRGGTLRAMYTWTIDAGEGADDYAVFITSEGEVLVFRGYDPTSSGTWALTGVWQLGQPLGRRCAVKYAGDLLVVLRDGVYPLSGALQSSQVNPRVAITDRIVQAMTDAGRDYGANFGWQPFFYPGADMVLLNVPRTVGSITDQYAMNTITGAWARFTGVVANCWEIYSEEPYFGSNTYVGRFWNGFSDRDASGAININGLCKQAFHYFGSRGQKKRWTMARPILSSDGTPTVGLSLNTDYADNDSAATLSFSPTSYAVWDSSLWDTGLWGGGLSVLRNWQNLGGIGQCAALRMKIASQGLEVHWQATDLAYELGGVL